MHTFYTNIEVFGKDVIVSGVYKNKRFIKKTSYKPELYILDKSGKYSSIYNEPLERIEFDNINEYKVFKNENNGLLKLYGDINPKYQFVRKNFSGRIEHDISKLNIVYFDIEVSSLDKHDRYIGFPFATIAPVPIVSVALYSTLSKEMTVYGLKSFDVNSRLNQNIKTTYKQFDDEYDLLVELTSYFKSNSTRPDILYGWNSDEFDVPYILNRMRKIGGDKFANTLSPNNFCYEVDAMKRVFGVNKPYKRQVIIGIPHLDMIDVYRKFSGENCSFSMALNNIANRDLKKGKLDYGSSRDLMSLFWDDHQRYIDYNIQDTFLLYEIDQYRDLTNKVVGTALGHKCNFIDTLGTTKQWETLLYNSYMDKGLVIPNKTHYEKIDYVGGYVRSPSMGIKKWNLTFDFTSMYPSLLYGMNMSPETLRHQWEDNCVTSVLDGVFFTKEYYGTIAEEVENAFIKRKEFKKLKKECESKNDLIGAKYYDILQYIEKLNINSVYGALANKHFLFFKPELAKCITTMGQYCIKSVGARINQVVNKITGSFDQNFVEFDIDEFITPENVEDFIVMGDTDSCAVSLEMYVDKFLNGKSDKEIVEHLVDLYEKAIKPEIDDCIDHIHKKFNFYKESMNLNLESITKKSIFLQKKRYLGHILYDEGTLTLDYETPNLKIKGLEGIKSSTPEYFQEKFVEFYKLCLLCDDNEVLRNHIKTAEHEYKTLYINDTGKPIKVNNLQKYSNDKNIYIKGTPENTKGCLIYNHFVKLFGLENKYDLLKDGDYGILLKLKPKNLLINRNRKGVLEPERVICIPETGITPTEFRLENFIYYEEQFNKFFKTPCVNILDIMGVSFKKYR